MVAPLTTCSARIPTYTLIIGAFIPNTTVWGFANLQGLVMFGLYATGIVSALIVAFIIRRIFWRGSAEPFLMQLPDYKTPNTHNETHNDKQHGEIFLKRAGTTI